MLVTVICKEKRYGVTLPEKVRGQYWIEDSEKETTDPGKRIVSIEARDGKWEIRKTGRLRLFGADGITYQDKLVLENGNLYPAELNGTQRVYIMTEPYTRDRCTFTKYMINGDTEINIGKGNRNQIVIDNPYVSNSHAKLAYTDKRWTISDCNSSNGVYVNEIRITGSMLLKPGDVIYILGFKIVIGADFIAINNPDGTVTVQSEALKKYQIPEICSYERPEEAAPGLYYRSPSFQREITPLSLKIDGPTAQENIEETPLILVLGPSLVMGVASFSSGLFSAINTLTNNGKLINALPSMIMSVSMLAGMLIFPFIIKVRDAKRKVKRENERRDKYLKYLQNVRQEINKAKVIQSEILNDNYPPVMSLINNPVFFESNLWGRMKGSHDFLKVRLGFGNIPLMADLAFPEYRFSIEDDILRDEVIRFSEETQLLEGVPIGVSLLDHRVAGVVGDSKAVEGILHNLILRIAMLHSYDEVKIVLLCDDDNIEKYGYIRWLQHVWSDDGHRRFMATNLEEVRELSAYFIRLIEKWKDTSSEIKTPHYIVISTSKGLSDRCALVSEILSDEELTCFSYLAVYDELKNLPIECSCIAQVNASQGTLYLKEDGHEKKLVFNQDMISKEVAERTVMKIAGYKLDLNNGRYRLPKMLTFLEMYHVGKYEHLNPASRWKENNPMISLQAPVGVNADGDLLYLDLHEKAHGPHGLVAGMTGSGKSEFIITYILSLAINYSPSEVAFILIDYKGGGLAGAFDNDAYRLPHLAGTITNLDGSAISRSFSSIQSELQRRQAIFQKAKRQSNDGTMDIYKYQKLYRNGVVAEPLPHLFIISDEFAELKAQQPEFMDQLISIARIGRSLGVHLILATQKPNGVVNDQIWANSRFKVCLKVQDRADSMDMLKCSDAAELVDTGRFYLQVGYNEIFEMGQSAWCGAPYIPKEEVTSDIDETVQLVDYQGNVLEEAKPKQAPDSDIGEMKQIVEITRYIAQIAKEEGMSAAPLWLPEIPADILINDTVQKYGYSDRGFLLNPAVGELDDPRHQRQEILTVPLSDQGNVLIYGVTGSGKEMFLTTLLYSLYCNHNSGELNAFILDFGSEKLHMFSRAPQTAEFIIAGEDEKIANLFQYIKREMLRRKKQFAEMGGDYASYCNSGMTDIPNIVIIINEYIAFAEQYEEFDDRFSAIARECIKYGIYFVVTSSSITGIRHKNIQCFNQTFVLQLNDKIDYVSVLGNTNGVYPSKYPGRGILRQDEVYEFQIARVTKSTDETSLYVQNFCRDLLEKSGQKKAEQVPILPGILSVESLRKYPVSFDALPYAMTYDTIEVVNVNLYQKGTIQVLANKERTLVPFAAGLSRQFAECEDSEVYVLDAGQQMTVSDKTEKIKHVTDHLEETIVELFNLTVQRHNACKASGGVLPEAMDRHPIFVILLGLNRLKEQLSEDGRDKLRLILERSRGKFYLSFWALDDYASSNRYCTEEWCDGNGIWVGDGVGEQIRFRLSARSIRNIKRLDAYSGCIIHDGEARPVKLVMTDSSERED